jgi:large subunit ribosomal protein L3
MTVTARFSWDLAPSRSQRSTSRWPVISRNKVQRLLVIFARFALASDDTFKVGDKVTVENFTEGAKVHVTGTSKGKGFAGVMRRYDFKGGPGGHGSHFHRVPGSVGECSTPSRVFKGMRLPGHMGCDTVTTKNLEVVKVDKEQNLILVKGAVPGGKNATVRVRLA